MQEANVTEAEAAAAKAEAEANDTNEDETSINSDNGDTSGGSTSDEGGQDTSENTDEANQELAEKNKQLFARAKKAEDELKALKIKDKPKTKGTDSLASADPIELAKTVNALKDFSSDEMDYVQLIANGKSLSLDEAVKTDEVKTYIEAKRAKVIGDNKTPSSSSPSSIVGGKTSEERENMSDKEYAKLIKEEMKGRRIGA